MALTNSIFWRVRSGGNNANGAGYDSATSGALATTLTGALTSGATTMTVASATGWPASGNYYVQIGAAGAEPSGGGSEIVLVTSGQGTTTWTITRAQLGTSALAAASGIAVTNELSRCNTAPWSGSTGTSTASTTFTAAAAGFNETVVGNVLYLASGTGATVGAYIVTGYTNSTTITLDRASGTYTLGVWKIGGAWADPATRGSLPLAGNTVFIRAGGSGTVASPDYSSGYPAYANGDSTNGQMRIVGENGRPVISCTNPAFTFGCSFTYIDNLYLFRSNTGSVGLISGNGVVKNCVFDLNGQDKLLIEWSGACVNCEFLSSTANFGAAGTGYAIVQSTYGLTLESCNIHDLWGNCIQTTSGYFTDIMNCLITNNKGTAVYIQNGSAQTPAFVKNCTISGNGADGIYVANAGSLAGLVIQNCIIANQTGSGKYGIKTGSGTTASNDRMRGIIGNNWYYNNTADALNLTVGATYGDSTGVDPGFVSTSVENYGITGTSVGWAAYTFMNNKSGTTPPRSYFNPGAVMSNPSGGSSTIIVGL